MTSVLLDERDVARIDAWLREQVAIAQYPSLSVAIVRDGKIAYQRAFGFEDLKARRKGDCGNFVSRRIRDEGIHNFAGSDAP